MLPIRAVAYSVLLVSSCQMEQDHPPFLAPNRSGGVESDGVDRADAGGGGRSEPNRSASAGALAEWVGPTDWTGLIRSIAASPDGAVYVSDSQRVFRVIDAEPEAFLTSSELGLLDTEDAVEAIAVDPDGNLHVLVGPFVTEDRVFDADGQAIGVIDFSEYTFPGYIAAAAADEVYVITRDGMVKASETGSDVLYDGVAIGGSPISCASEAIAVRRRRVYYLPGCNGSPLYGGAADGSAFGEISDDDEIHEVLKERTEYSGFFGFQGIAPHPSGGVIANMEGALVTVVDDGSWTTISTIPALHEVESGSLGFHSSPIATDGTNVYLLADDAIWIARGAAK